MQQLIDTAGLGFGPKKHPLPLVKPRHFLSHDYSNAKSYKDFFLNKKINKPLQAK
jgi:hypothetical protein